MPEWALGSFLLTYGERKYGVALSFNARVGAGFFSTDHSHHLLPCLFVASMPEWALGSFLRGEIPLVWQSIIRFNARVGAGFFSTQVAIAVTLLIAISFNARVGAGFFSTQ
jgi:adenylosuccinate synthase